MDKVLEKLKDLLFVFILCILLIAVLLMTIILTLFVFDIFNGAISHDLVSALIIPQLSKSVKISGVSPRFFVN